jgi:hypothetical protein
MVNLQVEFDGGGDDQDRRVFIGTATNEFPTNEGAFKLQRSSDSGDILSISTINKYTSGDTIAGYARNGGITDTLGSGSGNFVTFMEVAFLGGL